MPIHIIQKKITTSNRVQSTCSAVLSDGSSIPLEKYEFLILPVSQVLPFDVEKPYPTEINAEKMSTYIDWMKSCYYISTIGHPALSVPGAFSASGLPVGVQIVGRHRDDWGVLQLGYAFEQAGQLWKRHPKIAL